MIVEQRPLAVVVDGLRLNAGAYVPNDQRAVVVLLHGIPSVAPPDPEDSGYPGLADWFADNGYIACWADMRAVRGSPGFFSIEGWVRDARAVIDAARAIDGAAALPLALVGSSAGGAVSAEVVRRGAPVDALVLLAAPAAWLSFADDPAAGITRIIEEAGMPLAPEVFEDPAAWSKEFEGVATERSIVEVKVATLIVHGTADDVVPVHHADRIAERAPNAELKIIEGAGHQLRRNEEAMEIVFDWLERRLK